MRTPAGSAPRSASHPPAAAEMAARAPPGADAVIELGIIHALVLLVHADRAEAVAGIARGATLLDRGWHAGARIHAGAAALAAGIGQRAGRGRALVSDPRHGGVGHADIAFASAVQSMRAPR